MAKFIFKKAGRKAKKPHSDFPLFPRASDRWAKKVRGRFAYFGKASDDPKGEAALALWLEQKDELLGGRVPRTGDDRLTVRDQWRAAILISRVRQVADWPSPSGSC